MNTMSKNIETPRFTVAFQGGNWSFFPDGEVPLEWDIWSTGLTWAEAHDAINFPTPTI